MSELILLDAAQARVIAPLVGIGGKSGDTVVGLSALRRSRPLAWVFVSPDLGPATLRELAAWRREGTAVCQVQDWRELAGRCGRPDASVIGVRPGALAEGVQRRLRDSGAGEEQAEV